MSQSLPVTRLDRVVIRFAGDSGDGMQLTGGRFGTQSAQAGNDIATLPDFPAEIRAPQGSLGGVSSFQVHFADHDIVTTGEQLDALVAMNPAALRVHLPALRKGGLLITDSAEFNKRNLSRAGYGANPLEDGSLEPWQLVSIDLTSMTTAAVEPFGLNRKQASRSRNMFALGLASWLYSQSVTPTEQWLIAKFARAEQLRDANLAALRAGHAYGETAELFSVRYQVPQAELRRGRYRQVSGNQATALGLLAAAQRSGRQLFLGAYPITPASDLLHDLARRKAQGVMVCQAEDEIAAAGAALGASFGGALGVTTTSGPGFALKQETINLALMTELPLVIIDVQRAGPSTGMPTKAEQGDLLQALWGRNGESPLPVFAPRSPADCFSVTFEACRVALEHRTPVVVLTDAYLANGSEPWQYPQPADLPIIEPAFLVDVDDDFQPYRRDEKLARNWAIPGTAGLEHRIGGLEKSALTGAISYDGDNHDLMVRTRAEHVDSIPVPDADIDADADAQLAVVSWGSAWGSVTAAVRRVRAEGGKITHIHVPTLRPLPANLGAALQGYRRVIVPELNSGQLRLLLRATYLVDAQGFNRVRGLPLSVLELTEYLQAELSALAASEASSQGAQHD